MTQRSRAEYEAEMEMIAKGNMTTDVQKGNMMLNVIADILLDIREKLFNPDMKGPAEPRA